MLAFVQVATVLVVAFAIMPAVAHALEYAKLEGTSARFFEFNRLRNDSPRDTPTWTDLRDRWEHSHIIRAGLGLIGLTLLLAGVVTS